MPLPAADEWRITVNSQYQELMKIVINLATASLVLPVVFLKNIVEVAPGEVKTKLAPWAYRSWAALLLSLAASLLFYFASVKFVKVLSCPPGNGRSEHAIETMRDVAAWMAAAFFIGGLASLGVFFLSLLRP